MKHRIDKHQALILQIELARKKLHTRLDQHAWAGAEKINLKGGEIFPRKFRPAISIGTIFTDSETNEPLHCWYSSDGHYYVHNTWYSFHKVALEFQSNRLLKLILAGTRHAYK